VSTSGFREIQLVTCDQNGKMTYSGSSIRQGKVVFTK